MSHLILPQGNDAGVSWQNSNIRADSYYGAAANSTYLVTSTQNAGASNHRVYATEDVTTWRSSLSTSTYPSNQHITSISWNGSVFVSVANNGSIRTSSDTKTWTTRTSGTTNALKHVVSPSTNINIAVGNTGTILTSTNTGTTWTVRTSGTTSNLLGVASGASNAVAVGNGGIILLNTLSNGTGTWSTVTSPTTATLNSVVWAQSQYIVVGAGGIIFRSSDGTTWSSVTSPTTNTLNYVMWTGSLYIAVGDLGGIITSPDGVTWTSRLFNITQSLYTCAVFKSKLYAFGIYGIAFESTDGTTWNVANKIPTITINSNYTGIVEYNGMYVAITGAGDIITSSDLKNWNKQNTGVTGAQLVDIARIGGKFIAVGFPKIILTSPDAITWTSISNTAASTTTFSKIGYNPTTGTIFIGSNTSADAVFRSTDNGVTWSQQSLSLFGYATAILWTGSALYLSYAGGRLHKSTDDGVSWVLQSTTGLGTAGIESMAYGNGVFVVHGYIDGIFSSTDGLAWTYRTGYAAVGRANAALWTGTQFIFGSNQGSIYTSKDGVTWANKSSGMYGTINAITGNDSSLVVVGNTTNIATSPPISLTL